MVYFLTKVLQVLKNVAILCFNISRNKYIYFAFTVKQTRATLHMYTPNLPVP